MSQVLDTEKYKYKRTKVRGKDGRARYSANNGDAIARAMACMTHEDLVKVMQDNSLKDKLAKHLSKNSGHFRMILGQALRSMVTKNYAVNIRGIRVTSLKQDVELPKGLVEEPIVARK